MALNQNRMSLRYTLSNLGANQRSATDSVTTSQYSFPPRPMSLSMSKSQNSLDLENVQDGMIIPEVENFSPFFRSRVPTWGSTISDSGCSEISLNSSDGHLLSLTTTVNHKVINGASPSKRRFTCPDSMRTYQTRRPRARTGSASQKRPCAKISDADSDSDLEEACSPSEVDTSGYSSLVGNVELSIIRQPESHHRARYQKEGSRGCIKDRSGNACPAIQLKGYTAALAVLQVFIGTESGPIRAHPLYRVCKVGGKHSTPCRERLLDSSISALEMDLTRENNYMLNIDCLGIMKLRNADFEQINEADDLTKRRKRNPKVRLVFRTTLKMPNGSMETLQVASAQICCTPSPGLPEIHFISHTSCPASGGIDVVVIGRNFIKDDSKLFFVEKSDDDVLVWEKEATLLNENFNQVHLVGNIPAYRDPLIARPVEVSLYIRNKGGKQSEPCSFKYTPDDSVLLHLAAATPVCQAVASPTPRSPIDTKNSPLSLNKTVYAPTEQHLNNLVQSGNNVQYCIQLPGSNQPVIISIPQMSQFPYPSTSSDDQTPNTPITLNLNHLSVEAVSQSSKEQFAQPNDQIKQEATTALSDEDLFNDLLREILGNADSDGDAMMIDLPPPQSEMDTDCDASAAASSLRDLDINRHIQNDYAQVD